MNAKFRAPGSLFKKTPRAVLLLQSIAAQDDLVVTERDGFLDLHGSRQHTLDSAVLLAAEVLGACYDYHSKQKFGVAGSEYSDLVRARLLSLKPERLDPQTMTNKGGLVRPLRQQLLSYDKEVDIDLSSFLSDLAEELEYELQEKIRLAQAYAEDSAEYWAKERRQLDRAAGFQPGGQDYLCIMAEANDAKISLKEFALNYSV